METIGILTSGGDAPGMNAAIRAITRTALNSGMRVKGVRSGYDGLINGDIYELNVSSVADIIHRGGTILGSARSMEFKTKEGQDKAAQILHDFGIEGLIVLGGDGSFMGANALHLRGIKTIGIPCTIDNDMGYTDYTIGFHTAVETVIEAISKLRDTSSSHGRANILEVMGRKCGDIALYAGLTGGAESILVPEVEYNLDEVCENILKNKRRGKMHHIILSAEGIGKPYEMGKYINEKTGVETKVTILGHIQRGGSPSFTDRLYACEMGNMAVELLKSGQSSLAIGINKGELKTTPIEEAVKMKRVFNTHLLEIARELSN